MATTLGSGRARDRPGSSRTSPRLNCDSSSLTSGQSDRCSRSTMPDMLGVCYVIKHGVDTHQHRVHVVCVTIVIHYKYRSV